MPPIAGQSPAVLLEHLLRVPVVHRIAHRADSSLMMDRSSLASPGGTMAFRTRCTRRSVS